MIENPVQPWIEDDFDLLKADHQLHQHLSEINAHHPIEQPSMQDVVKGLLRIGAAAIILSIVTGMMQVGAVVAVIGTAWLYYRLS